MSKSTFSICEKQHFHSLNVNINAILHAISYKDQKLLEEFSKAAKRLLEITNKFLVLNGVEEIENFDEFSYHFMKNLKKED